MNNRNAETMYSVIRRHVLPGSIIITDGWRVYLGTDAFGYDHLTVNHLKEWVNTETDAHTNNIEDTWSAIKSFLSKW